MSRLKGFAAYDGVSPAATYAPALQMLFKEHSKIRKWLEEAWKVAQRAAKERSLSLFERWLCMEQQVRSVWSLHAAKEERVLLSMLTKYVDSEHGPLAVMRYEHEQIEALLDQFEENMRKLLDDPADEKAFDEAFERFHSAYQIKSSHCFKEEKAIYAMAQSMLSESEKMQMLQQMKKIK